MSSYVGKLQIGNNAVDQLAFGDILFGTCSSGAYASTKIISLDYLDDVMNGLQIRVKFINGNSVTSGVQFQINTGDQIPNYFVYGDCTCAANDIITFTWESSYWHVTGNNLTQTIKDYVQSVAAGEVSNVDNMVFKGTIGFGGTFNTVPTGNASSEPSQAYRVGYTYKIIAPGEYAGNICEIGDLLIATANSINDQTMVNNNHWTVVQGNINSAVSGPSSSGTNHVAIFSNTTGKIIEDSGYTIETSVPRNALFTDENTTYKYTITNTPVAVYNNCSVANSGGTILVNINNGVLELAPCLAFNTANVVSSNITLNENIVAGPILPVTE